MRKSINIFLSLLLGNTGQNALLSEKTESYFGLLCLFQETKSVYSFKPCFEEERIFKN